MGYLLVSVLVGELLRASLFIADPGIRSFSRSSKMPLIQIVMSFERQA